MASITPPLLFIGTGDLYLHGQMLTYYGIALILGAALGWAIWGWGRAEKIKRAYQAGVRDAERKADAAGAAGELGQLRTELDISTKARITLEARLDQAQQDLRAYEGRPLPSPTPEPLPPQPPSGTPDESERTIPTDPVSELETSTPPPAAANEIAEMPVTAAGVVETVPQIDLEASEPDDLTKIKGIGRKLAAQLNELGISSLAEIAAWSDDDIAEIDKKLRFKGRITRDDWVGQARLLIADER
ncbi:MAG: helix-hairpin-helix domain-containing protein [Pseudomonadota bacterium]